MKPRGAKLIFAARVIAVAYIFFLMLFSFDVFALGGGIMEQIGGFLIHSAPSIVMIVVLVVFWKRPFVLGWVFAGIAVVLTIWFQTYVRPESFLIITLPPLAAGILFLLSKRKSGSTGRITG